MRARCGEDLRISHLDFRWKLVVNFSILAFESQIIPFYSAFRTLTTATVVQHGQKIEIIYSGFY